MLASHNRRSLHSEFSLSIGCGLLPGLTGILAPTGSGTGHEPLLPEDNMDIFQDSLLVTAVEQTWASGPTLGQTDKMLSQLGHGSLPAQRSPSCPGSHVSDADVFTGGAAPASCYERPDLMVPRPHSAPPQRPLAASQWQPLSPSAPVPAAGSSQYHTMRNTSVMQVAPYTSSPVTPVLHDFAAGRQQAGPEAAQATGTPISNMDSAIVLTAEEKQHLMEILMPKPEPISPSLQQFPQQQMQAANLQHWPQQMKYSPSLQQYPQSQVQFHYLQQYPVQQLHAPRMQYQQVVSTQLQLTSGYEPCYQAQQQLSSPDLQMQAAPAFGQFIKPMLSPIRVARPRPSAPQQPKQKPPQQFVVKRQAVMRKPGQQPTKLQVLGLPSSPYTTDSPMRKGAQKKAQQNQQQQDMQADLTEPDSGAEAGSLEPTKKRGRPPLNPGKYSRGYLAIKAYRLRKKGMIEQWEAEIAEKMQLVQELELENQKLRLKQQLLEQTIAVSDEVVRQLASLQLSGGAELSVTASGVSISSSGIGASSDTTAAALDRAVSSETYSNSCCTATSSACGVNWSAVLARTEREIQGVSTLAQQQLFLQQSSACDAAVGCYKAYVADTTAKLTGQCSVYMSDASADESALLPFPLDVSSMVQIWQLHRSAAPGTAAGAAALTVGSSSSSGCSPGGSTEAASGGFAVLNLASGGLSHVGDEFWAVVAQQMALLPGQQLQLEYVWDLYAAALASLQDEWQRLQLQLMPAPGQSVESSLSVAAAVEAYLLRAQAVFLTYDWVMACAMSDGQLSGMCVASWPHLPVVTAVVGHMIGRPEGQGCSATEMEL